MSHTPRDPYGPGVVLFLGALWALVSLSNPHFSIGLLLIGIALMLLGLLLIKQES